MQIDAEILKESLRIVKEKDPETLYRVMNALMVYNSSPEVLAQKEQEIAFFIKKLYIDGDETPPHSVSELVNKIGEIADQYEDEETEIDQINHQVEIDKFIEENSLVSLVVILGETLGSEDQELDAEFLYDFVKSGNDLPDTLDELVVAYHAWLIVHLWL